MVVIRRAEKKDIPNVLKLLSAVLEHHAKMRPDLFVSGTTKYSAEDLEQIFTDDRTPVFVAVDDRDEAIGHVFLQIVEIRDRNRNPVRSLYFDDFCVDPAHRGEHVGEALTRFVVEEARRLGCAETVLNVWEGNEIARGMFERLGWKVRKTQLEFPLS